MRQFVRRLSSARPAWPTATVSDPSSTKDVSRQLLDRLRDRSALPDRRRDAACEAEQDPARGLRDAAARPAEHREHVLDPRADPGRFEHRVPGGAAGGDRLRGRANAQRDAEARRSRVDDRDWDGGLARSQLGCGKGSRRPCVEVDRDDRTGSSRGCALVGGGELGGRRLRRRGDGARPQALVEPVERRHRSSKGRPSSVTGIWTTSTPILAASVSDSSELESVQIATAVSGVGSTEPPKSGGAGFAGAGAGSGKLEVVGMAEADGAGEPRGDDEHRRGVRERKRGCGRRPPRVRQPAPPPDDAREEPGGRRTQLSRRAPAAARRACARRRSRARGRAARPRGTCRGTARSSSRRPCLRGSRSTPGSSARRRPRRRRRARRCRRRPSVRRRSRRSPSRRRPRSRRDRRWLRAGASRSRRRGSGCRCGGGRRRLVLRNGRRGRRTVRCRAGSRRPLPRGDEGAA